VHTLSIQKMGPMRFGTQLNLRKHSIARFAVALIAACIVNACATTAELPNKTGNQDIHANLATQVPIEQCKDDLAVRDLDSIRSKADISRKAAEGPPPFRIALNDTFATKSERAVIAKWITIWNHCRRRFELPRIAPPTANAIEAASLQQEFALSRIFQASVGQLIRALYYQELTYGEFARKRFEFTRDAVALSSAINEAGLDPNQTRLGQTLRQLLYLRLSWNSYLRRVNARQPGTVHIRGAIYI
jgi:hypothetical protein